jgi:hypothetical protein
MGRAPSHRSDSADAAKAYLRQVWGEDTVKVAGYVLGVVKVSQIARERVIEGNSKTSEVRENLESARSSSPRLRRLASDLPGTVVQLAFTATTHGTAKRLREVADALREYETKPGARAGRMLRGTLRPRGPASWRVDLVKRARRASPRLADATASEWAYFEIAAGRDVPCCPDDFGRLRRDRWREVLREAARVTSPAV